MENPKYNFVEENSTEFTEDYFKIVNPNQDTVVVFSEWQKEGDFFKKLTAYDESYETIPSIGGTTLI